MTELIKKINIFDGNSFAIKDIFIQNNKIIQISDNINIKNINIFNGENLIICHGFIDLHTHLREPGFEYKETIKTGTNAALAGGFTTVCSMPNLNPVPDNLENLNVQLKKIKDNAVCNVRPFMSITKNRLGKEIINMKNFPKICAGISDDGNGVQDDQIMEKAMREAAENNILISAHCENKKFGISCEAEFDHIKRDINFVKKYKCRYHICHVSCKKSIEIIQEAKFLGLPVTCEVTPHHALLCSENNNFYVNPPLRNKINMQAIQKAIQDGTIDVFATDHAPHTKFEKQNKICGASGLECAFSVLYTGLVKTGIINLKYLLKMLTVNPGKILGVNSCLKENEDINAVIFDLNKKSIITGSKFISKGKFTPFENKSVYGKIIKSVINI